MFKTETLVGLFSPSREKKLLAWLNGKGSGQYLRAGTSLNLGGSLQGSAVLSRPIWRVKIKFQVNRQEKFPEEWYSSKYSSFTPKSRVFFSLNHEYLYHSGSFIYCNLHYNFIFLILVCIEGTKKTYLARSLRFAFGWIKQGRREHELDQGQTALYWELSFYTGFGIALFFFSDSFSWWVVGL